MADRKNDLRRRRMPIEEWPETDQSAWTAATRSGGLLDDAGLAAHWRPGTKKKVAAAYGRYLTFLACEGVLIPEAAPQERLTPDRLRAYIAELSKAVAPVTLSGLITDLAEAYRVMTPDAEFPYLQRAHRRLSARARPSREKRCRVVPVSRLVQLGLSLMRDAEEGSFQREMWRATRFRDGLIILVLACRPLRLRNLAEIRPGTELVKQGDAYTLSFAASQMKGRRAYTAMLQPELTPYIDRYLERYRPVLLDGQSSDFLWIAAIRREVMGHKALYDRIRERTQVAFGHPLNPHLFRDCAMTSLADESPAHVWLSMAVLGHADTRIAEQAYNQATDTKAVTSYQALLQGSRREILRTKKRDAARQRRLRSSARGPG